MHNKLNIFKVCHLSIFHNCIHLWDHQHNEVINCNFIPQPLPLTSCPVTTLSVFNHSLFIFSLMWDVSLYTVRIFY